MSTGELTALVIAVVAALLAIALGLLAIVGGSERGSHKRAMVDHKIFKPSRVATQMERYYREHPAATHSRICRNCGAVTSSAGADCTVCRLLLNGGKP